MDPFFDIGSQWIELVRERDEARAEIARLQERNRRLEEALAAICQWPHPVSNIAIQALVDTPITHDVD